MSQTTEVKYGLQVFGKVRVFRKDKELQGKGKKKFTITDVWFNVSEEDKNEQSGYFNKSMNLYFGKDADRPENNTTIVIGEAFPIITGNGEYRRIGLFVKSWEADTEKVNKDLSFRQAQDYSDGLTITDDDIPF